MAKVMNKTRKIAKLYIRDVTAIVLQYYNGLYDIKKLPKRLTGDGKFTTLAIVLLAPLITAYTLAEFLYNLWMAVVFTIMAAVAAFTIMPVFIAIAKTVIYFLLHGTRHFIKKEYQVVVNSDDEEIEEEEVKADV